MASASKSSPPSLSRTVRSAFAASSDSNRAIEEKVTNATTDEIEELKKNSAVTEIVVNLSNRILQDTKFKKRELPRLNETQKSALKQSIKDHCLAFRKIIKHAQICTNINTHTSHVVHEDVLKLSDISEKAREIYYAIMHLNDGSKLKINIELLDKLKPLCQSDTKMYFKDGYSKQIYSKKALLLRKDNCKILQNLLEDEFNLPVTRDNLCIIC